MQIHIFIEDRQNLQRCLFFSSESFKMREKFLFYIEHVLATIFPQTNISLMWSKINKYIPDNFVDFNKILIYKLVSYF